MTPPHHEKRDARRECEHEKQDARHEWGYFCPTCFTTPNPRGAPNTRPEWLHYSRNLKANDGRTSAAQSTGALKETPGLATSLPKEGRIRPSQFFSLLCIWSLLVGNSYRSDVFKFLLQLFCIIIRGHKDLMCVVGFVVVCPWGRRNKQTLQVKQDWTWSRGCKNQKVKDFAFEEASIPQIAQKCLRIITMFRARYVLYQSLQSCHTSRILWSENRVTQ